MFDTENLKTFDWIKAGGFKKLFAKKTVASAETVPTETTAEGETK